MTIQRYDWSSIEPWAEFKKMPNGDYMLYNDHLAARSIYEADRAKLLARYDEAIRLLWEWHNGECYPLTETETFLATEPKGDAE